MGRLKAELCDQKCSVPQLLKELELELEYSLVLPGAKRKAEHQMNLWTGECGDFTGD